ncbi:MAG TPA: translation elongation factor Ts [Alphaproteobacteria bacterium]|nr:translation elongation factor Ts [Alphaproteobacteria bacterium]
MAEITAALVKELREKTGAGMMDCKKALNATSGELEPAVDWLRKQGLAAASKKAGRVAAEGLVGALTTGKDGVLVEVNSETDFVARNETFQDFVVKVAEVALTQNGDMEKVKAAAYPGGKTVGDKLTELIGSIGENMQLRRSAKLSVSQGAVVSYIHSAAAPNLGKIGVLVALESAGDADKLQALGKQIAMHVAAANPQSLSVESLDKSAIDRERNVLSEQARASGKPEEIIAKMVEGRLRKFYEEVVLLEQVYIIDGESKVSKIVAEAAKTIGAPVKISGFLRFALGEGIEKAQTDFAAEVAATVGH